MRREFPLPETDERYMNATGRSWETVVDGETLWLLVHDWPLPSGYNHASATVGIMIPTAYPDAPLDMAYFSPHLARSDGKSIRATSNHTAVGEQWQRWSRHYSNENPWRVGEDDLSTHLTLLDTWLKGALN